MAVAGSLSDGAFASPALTQTGRRSAPDDGVPEWRPAAAPPALAPTSTAANGNRAVVAADATAGGGDARSAGATGTAGTRRGGPAPGGGASPPRPSPPSAASAAARSASPAPAGATMFSPSASARATAAAVTEQRLQQLIRERAGLEPHRSRWPATWALLEGEVARLCRLANAAGVAAAVAAGSASGGGQQGRGGGELSLAAGGGGRDRRCRPSGTPWVLQGAGNGHPHRLRRRMVAVALLVFHRTCKRSRRRGRSRPAARRRLLH